MASLFPHTSKPLICNAPMYGQVTAELATEVTKAGGLGFLVSTFDFSSGSAQIDAINKQLQQATKLLEWENKPFSENLPVGVGALTCHPSVEHFPETFIPVLKQYRPAALWLFAPDPAYPNRHKVIIDAVRALSKDGINIKIIVQVGSVAAARQAAEQGADIIVAQGIDAGGHQWANGASILTLLPEIRDMLDREFHERNIGVLTAGGIVDGRGVAAALALGADGIVMGTRFVASHETQTPEQMKDAIISATDGGSATKKSTIHDDFQKTAIWADLYDGRAIVGPCFQDHLAGLPMDEVVRKHDEAVQAGDMSRRVVWAGTGVGLIKENKGAGEIVKSVQQEAKAILKKLGL